MIRKSCMYVADFETVTAYTKYYQKHLDTKVMLYCMKSLDGSDKWIGTSINQFFNDLRNFKKVKNIMVYFHNLSFDGDFILKYLDSKGFKGVNEYLDVNQFKVLRQNRSIYKIEVCLLTKMNKKLIVNFHCSLKLLSSPVEDLGKALGISKHNEETNSKDFYNVEPRKLISEYSRSYVEYCERDVDIVRLSLINFFNNIEQTCNEHWFLSNPNWVKVLTIGGLAYKFQKDFARNYDLNISLKTDSWTHEIASKFYFGGFTQFNPKIQGKVIKCKNGSAYDVNSMYPSSMLKLLPYGKIYDFEEEQPKHGSIYLEYWEMEIESAISKNGNFLCLANWNKINKSNSFTKHRYVEQLFNFKCFYLKQEFEALKKFYSFSGVKIVKKYWAYADYFLKDYINTFYKYKMDYGKQGKKAISNTYKILLNSSYGKHATRMNFDLIYFCKNKNEYYSILKLEKFEFNNKMYNVKEANDIIDLPNQLVLKLVPELEENSSKYFNKLIAATITAWSRIKLYESIYDAGESNFLYCDTDSMYLKDIKPNNQIEFDDFKLGAWKKEESFNYFITKGAKAYTISNSKEFNDPIKYAFSGVTKSWLAKNFDLAFYETEEICLKESKLKQVSCRSGLVLIWEDYESKPRLH